MSEKIGKPIEFDPAGLAAAETAFKLLYRDLNACDLTDGHHVIKLLAYSSEPAWQHVEQAALHILRAVITDAVTGQPELQPIPVHTFAQEVLHEHYDNGEGAEYNLRKNFRQYRLMREEEEREAREDFQTIGHDDEPI